MDNNTIQRLRDLPIEGVAQRLGLTLVRNHRTVCCFHTDKNPSLSFDTRRNSYRCWSCGARGGVIDLVMRAKGKTFVEACRWLADEYNMILEAVASIQATGGSMTGEARGTDGDAATRRTFDAERYARYFEHPWLSDAARSFLYDVRHLDPRVVQWCRLNSYGDWLQIPYYDRAWRLLGVQRRYMGSDPEEPRFRFMRGEECHLYGQQILPLLRQGEPLWVGEGPSDVWALLSSGRKAIGIPSATLLKASDLELLHPLRTLATPLHICPDRDAAGEALYARLHKAAAGLGLTLERHDLPEGCKDFSDWWMGESR